MRQTPRARGRRIRAWALVAGVASLWGCSAIARYLEPEPDVDAEVAVFVSQLNTERIRMGCPTLSWDRRAAEVARAHATDMVDRSYVSHDNPEGQDPFDRLRAAGLEYRGAAENIGEGPREGAELFRRWLTSAGHRENMLNCSFTRQGVARVGDVWTQILFLPADGAR